MFPAIDLLISQVTAIESLTEHTYNYAQLSILVRLRSRSLRQTDSLDFTFDSPSDKVGESPRNPEALDTEARLAGPRAASSHLASARPSPPPSY